LQKIYVQICCIFPVLILSCSHRPPEEPPNASPPDPRILDRVHEVSGKQILSDAQDAEYWQLAKDVANSRILVGLSQDQVASRLGGAGTPCGSAFDTRNAHQIARWCYSIGQLPPGTTGGTPVLVVDFDATNVCRSSHAVRTQ
jgi:hypothetical protein